MDTSAPSNHTLMYASTIKVMHAVEPMRAGNYLVVGLVGSLPARCVECNAAEVGVPESLLIKPFSSFRCGSGLSLAVSNPHVALQVYYCGRHQDLRRRLWRWKLGLTLSCLLSCFGAMQCARIESGPGLLICVAAAVLLLGTTALVSLIPPRRLRIHHIADEYAYLKGAGRPFLDSLPGSLSSCTS